jgi:hypothetical protein
MSEVRFTRRAADDLARRVTALGGETISVRAHHTDGRRCYSIQRHNQYDERLSSSLSFGPDVAVARERFTASEAALVLAGMLYGIEIATAPGGARTE